MTPLVWHVGDVVRKLRDAGGMSQRDLADRAGLNISTVVRLEDGAVVTVETLTAVAGAFDMSLGALTALIPGYAAPAVPARPTFGSNVRRLREARGWTQKQLADLLEVQSGQMSNWEHDRFGLPDGSTLIRVSRALGCSIDELLAGVEPEVRR